MKPTSSPALLSTVVVGFIGLLLVLYWPALFGPFVFDDVPNLEPVHLWLTGNRGFWLVALGNESGPLHRPVSMLSFLANAALNGDNPWGYKLGNLLLHLANAGLIALLARRLLATADRVTTGTTFVAVLIAAFWALHPIQVSTVAYVIQRMAMLSTFFTLGALLVYAIALGSPVTAFKRRLALFVVIPLLTLLAAFSKENGLLVPAFCLALQLGWLDRDGQRWPSELRWFFGLFLLLPLIAGLLLLLWEPSFFLAGYASREFSLGQRLLSEPRILLGYVLTWFAPNTVIGVVHMDDVQASSGLFSPPLTAIAMAVWLAALAIGWRLRKAWPALLGSLLFFLAGHTMESSVLPLELAFEHRNYLASLAFPLGIGTLLWQSEKVCTWARSQRRLLVAIILVGVAFFSLFTGMLAAEWSSPDRLIQRAYAMRPASTRAQLDYADLVTRRGQAELALDIVARLQDSPSKRARVKGYAFTQRRLCLAGKPMDDDWQQRLIEMTPTPLSLNELTIAEILHNTAEKGLCPDLTAGQVADVLLGLINHTNQPNTDLAVWRIRNIAARALNTAGRFEQARQQAAKAWQDSSGDAWVGVLLVIATYQSGDIDEARRLLPEVQAAIPKSYLAAHRALQSLAEHIEAGPQSTPDDQNQAEAD